MHGHTTPHPPTPLPVVLLLPWKPQEGAGRAEGWGLLLGESTGRFSPSTVPPAGLSSLSLQPDTDPGHVHGGKAHRRCQNVLIPQHSQK